MLTGIHVRFFRMLTKTASVVEGLTSARHTRIQVAEHIWRQWGAEQKGKAAREEMNSVRVGFFDGGSRGNPGPGGSGSVIVECCRNGDESTLVWAAVTALGSRKMTNNVAEFVGLHRLLAKAVAKGWRGMYVVGDSEMILRLMRTRTPPKAKGLIHWYNEASRVADICGVAGWEHHFRRHNKMADWLANQAMDWKRSVMEDLEDNATSSRLRVGVVARMPGDVAEWRERRQQGTAL
jgi:ribonuclease HI